MAIAPIDLQTIFSQVDKVGRAQMAEKQGQALTQSIQGAELQRKTEEKINQVNETQDTGEGPDKIKDQNKRNNSDSKKEEKKQKDKKDEEHQLSVLRDPSLGNKVDIST